MRLGGFVLPNGGTEPLQKIERPFYLLSEIVAIGNTHRHRNEPERCPRTVPETAPKRLVRAPRSRDDAARTPRPARGFASCGSLDRRRARCARSHAPAEDGRGGAS